MGPCSQRTVESVGSRDADATSSQDATLEYEEYDESEFCRGIEDAFSAVVADLGRAAEFSLTGERLSNTPPPSDLPPADVAVRFGGAHFPETWRQMGSYCTAYALVDMIGACEHYFQELDFIANIVQQKLQIEGPLSPSEYGRIKYECAMDKSPLWDLVKKALRKLNLDPGKVNDGLLKDPNKLRRCLVHRRGIVGPADVSDGGEFVVSWLKTTVYVNDQAVNSFPDLAETDGVITFRLEERSRAWKHGDTVALTAEDCNDIAFSLAFFCLEIRNGMCTAVRDLFSFTQ